MYNYRNEPKRLPRGTRQNVEFSSNVSYSYLEQKQFIIDIYLRIII